MNALGVNKCDFWESETHRQIVSAGVVEVYEYGEYKRRKCAGMKQICIVFRLTQQGVCKNLQRIQTLRTSYLSSK